MGFTHLHLHTEHSLLDGTTQIKKLFPRLKEMGMDAVAITEHGNMQATIAKYQLAKKEGIKLIFGVELYVVDDVTVKKRGEKRYHLVVLAKDLTGYKNLIKLVSIASRKENFYYRPRVDKKILRQYTEGLICTSACIGNDIAQAIIHDKEELAKEKIQEYIDIFGKENFYLEVENHGIEEENKVRDAYYRLAPEFGLKLIATADAHFLLKDDARAHEVMLCIQTNKTIDDEKRFKFDGDGYHVMSEDEMRERFPGRDDVIENTAEIASRCNVELELDNHVFPDFDVPEGMTHGDYLNHLCLEGLNRKYKDAPNYDEALERMNFELSVIGKMGFETYFLIVADFIRESRKHCQVGPGRGSGAGSIVAYVLDITQVEPLGLNLLFERFLNPDRISLPDFDVDFGDKDVALDYVTNKYGAEKIALIGTFGTMSAKSVLKDVARVFNVGFGISNAITKHITESTIQKSLDLVDDRKQKVNTELIKYEQEYPEVFEIAKRLEGCVRHKGIHACGVVWGKTDIEEYTPVYEKDTTVVTQLDGREVESAGLVKFDFLGLETLNITKKVLDTIGKTNEWLEKIPLDDDNVYQMLRDADSIGTFQMESPGMQQTLKLVKPTEFEDIIAILSLYRPGSMDSIPVYAKRKEGMESFSYVHPKAEPILSSTYGILVYQEQVMQLSRALANFSMGDSDVLRKAIGKKKLDLMMKMEAQFKEGCIEFSGMKPKVVNDLWDNIVKFASYSFNKSHAAAYALISYRTAYLKRYYKEEFMSSVISSSTKNPEKMSFYIEATKNMGVKILPPEINFSMRSFTIEKFGSRKDIRFGLSGIKHVGDEAINEIISKRPFSSYQDFINKVDLSKVNKRVLNALISVGAFDSFQYNRAELLEVYEKVKKEDSKPKQMTLFGTFTDEVVYPSLPDLSLREILDHEKALLGVYVSGHPLDLYRVPRGQKTLVYDTLQPDKDVEIFGLVKEYRVATTKNGDDMAFIKVVNKMSECDVVVFPGLFENELRGRALDEEGGILIRGTCREDEVWGKNIIAENVVYPLPRLNQ